MKTTIVKSVNGLGEKCKTYIYEDDNLFFFRKYILVPINSRNESNYFEVVIKQTENYTLTYSKFGIKKSTLAQGILQLKNNQKKFNR